MFDQDQGSSDDFLGRLTLSPHELDCNGQREYWMALEETETGQVLIRLTWLQLSEDLSLLNAQLEWRRRLHLRYGRTMDSLIRGGQSTVAKQSNTGSTEKNEYPYGSIFIVLLYLNSVRQLPLLGVNRQEPSVYVNIALDWRRRRSITIENTCNPMFEQSFHLLTGPISDQTPLRFELVNAVTGKTFGCAAIDLWQLIQSAQLTFDEPIAVRVDQCGECQLRVALELRLLTSNNRDPFSKVSSDSYDHHDYDHSPPSPRSVLHQASHESAVICEPDAPSQVPSLDEVIQSTVEPFVRTMQYDPISDSRPPFAQANKSASSLNK